MPVAEVGYQLLVVNITMLYRPSNWLHKTLLLVLSFIGVFFSNFYAHTVMVAVFGCLSLGFLLSSKGS